MASFGRVLMSIPLFSTPVLRNWSSRKRVANLIRRNYSGAYEAEGKTHAIVLNQDFGAPLMIDSISELGFKMNNGLSCMGPIAIFPNTILSWDVGDISQIDENSLSLFWLLEPKVDVLVIGIGSKDESNNKEIFKIISLIRKYKIGIEVLPTESACAVFNFLNADRRFVGAALLPPKIITGERDTIILNKDSRNIATPANFRVIDK